MWDVCSDQEAVDQVRNVQDPVTASKLLVDHALSRFSTDNLSCMIVRLDRDGLVKTQKNRAMGVETEGASTAKVSEADKIVLQTKQKIADGSTPAVGVSASNSGRGHDPVPIEEVEFVPTLLEGSVEEEPTPLDEKNPGVADRPAEPAAVEKAEPDSSKLEKDAGA